jgi:hypothetical protein
VLAVGAGQQRRAAQAVCDRSLQLVEALADGGEQQRAQLRPLARHHLGLVQVQRLADDLPLDLAHRIGERGALLRRELPRGDVRALDARDAVQRQVRGEALGAEQPALDEHVDGGRGALADDARLELDAGRAGGGPALGRAIDHPGVQ